MPFRPIGVDDNSLFPTRVITALKTIFLQKAGEAGIFAKSNGVVGNGSTDDSAAINALITSTSSAGGGTIIFAAGDYYINSPIILKQGVYLASAAPNHGYNGIRTVRFVAGTGISASAYVIDTIAGGIATAGGIGIDVQGNGSCGGVRFSRIAWGCWKNSAITNCGLSGLWEGGGFADVFEDLLITNCLMTIPTGFAGAFDMGNTVDSIQGTDHYVSRGEFAARGSGSSALASSNSYVAAAVVRGSNHFLADCVAETSDVGWYVTCQKTSFSHVRADTNKGHGFWLVAGSNVFTGCRAIGNSQSGTNLYDGFYVEGGAWMTKLIDPTVLVAGSIKPRYGINSSTYGGDSVYALQVINPTVEDAGTARYNLSGYFGVVFPPISRDPSASATPDVHESSGPFDFSGWATTTVTNFVGGVDGQCISVLGGTNVTIANNSSIATSTGSAKVLAKGIYRFTLRSGVWYEDR